MVVKFLVALAAFLIGGYSAWKGIQIIIARELNELKKAARETLSDTIAILRKGQKAPISLDDVIKFVDAVTKLLGVKTGPGAFLCLFGLALGVAGYWVLTSI
jgi:hypothetical protein